MKLYQNLINKNEKIAVVGLGYVGMPLAIAFAKHVEVIGFDVNQEKIELYRAGVDPTNEVGNDEIKRTTIHFTTDEKKLKESKFHIVAVPTPITETKEPDLTLIASASSLIGRNLAKGTIIVFESTVYPGVTQEICIPILEKESGLKCGIDFKIGYSPERINPSDKVNTLDKIVKIVSATDEQARDEIAKIYELIINAGVYKASSIKVAEAAKVIENSQRDVNIAFMNEVAMVLDKLNIDTNDVVEAMNTKWNALDFRPGLVGGHCISVDPHYFTYLASKLGQESKIISASREINDSVGEFIAEAILKKLILTDRIISQAKVVILGMTFKENCPDIRNSKVMDMITKLRNYGIEPLIADPVADVLEVKDEYELDLSELTDIKDADCVVFSVAHQIFKEMDLDQIGRLFKQSEPNNKRIIIDVKSILDKNTIKAVGYQYWSL